MEHARTRDGDGFDDGPGDTPGNGADDGSDDRSDDGFGSRLVRGEARGP
ncbi:hypothetical protein ACFRCX_18435 [Streptomyces sp. NPDC056652]